MQKKIIALAIAAAFAAPTAVMAAAHGAGGVTVYGSIDAGLRHQTNDAPAQGTTDSMQLGQYNSTRWGIKSVEDMGDGLKTNVTLEGSLTTPVTTHPGTQTVGFNPTSGMFDRQATIGLEGGFGKVDIGYGYTASFKTIVKYDPFNYKFLGVALAKKANYEDRQGGFFYDTKFGDVSVTADYYMNNSSATTQPTTGTGRAIAANFASGPISAGASYTAIESTLGADNPTTHISAGAGFNYGNGTAKIGYGKQSQKNGTSDKTDTTMWLGADFNMSSKMAVTGAYYSRVDNAGGGATVDSTDKRILVGLTYAMSKKTTAYFAVDKTTTNAGTTTAKDVVTNGTAVGLSTVF